MRSHTALALGARMGDLNSLIPDMFATAPVDIFGFLMEVARTRAFSTSRSVRLRVRSVGRPLMRSPVAGLDQRLMN